MKPPSSSAFRPAVCMAGWNAPGPCSASASPGEVLTLAAALSAAALSESVARAALAPAFVVSSTRAALLLAGGQPLTASVVAPSVVALTQEVLKTMLLTKLKLGAGAMLCAGLFAALVASVASLAYAQDAKPKPQETVLDNPDQRDKVEGDEDFIRRISMDLRGTRPTPAEIHFFVASQDAGRRQKLVDLFIQERQARQQLDERKKATDARPPSQDAPLAKSRWQTRPDEVEDLLKAARLRERIEKDRRGSEDPQKKQDTSAPSLPLPAGLNGVIDRIDPTHELLDPLHRLGRRPGEESDAGRLPPATSAFVPRKNPHHRRIVTESGCPAHGQPPDEPPGPASGRPRDVSAAGVGGRELVLCQLLDFGVPYSPVRENPRSGEGGYPKIKR